MKSVRMISTVCILCSIITLQGWLTSKAIAAEPAAPVTPISATAAVEPNGPAPKIHFDQTIYDFGPISPGSANTGEFKFENKGNAVLEINDITKTCGCTVPELEKKKYAPGESGTIKVTYNADKSIGVRTRKLYVASNDPVNPKVELTVKATITEKVISEPDKLDYTLKGKNAGQGDITLRSLDNQPFSITKVESTGNVVTANINTDQNEQKITLKTRIDTDKVKTNYNGRIEITITHPDCKTISIPFTILPRFRTEPSTINIVNAEQEKTIQKELWLLSNYEEDFEVESATSREGIIRVAGQEKLGNRCKFTLDITPPEAKNAARMFTDILTVKTKDGEKMDITCRGFYVRKQG